MALEDWQALGIVCGALIAFLTLVGLTWRWGVRPVWRTLRRLNEVADLLLGDKEREVPSLQDRLGAFSDRITATENRITATEKAHAGHLRTHTQLQPNGSPRTRR